MKLTAGYDRNFAEQFFRRTFHSLAPDGRTDEGRVLPLEVDYMASVLADTAVFSNQPRLGSPWFRGSVEELVQLTSDTSNRRLLQAAEDTANQLMLVEGLVARGILRVRRERRRGDVPQIDRQKFAGQLYRHVSNWRWHSEEHRFVLRRLSANVGPWVDLLGRVPGNDYLEMLGERSSSILVIPGED